MAQETNSAELKQRKVERRQVFNNPQFGELRVLGTAEKPLFCLNDVCKCLELQPSRVRERLDACYLNSIKVATEVIAHGKPTGKMQERKMLFIDEPNLYRCIFQSRKKEAKAFQDWVFNDVLPSIRKQGGYIVTKHDDTEDDIMARALLIAENRVKALKDRNATLQAACDGYETQRIEANKRIEALASSNEQKAIEIKQLTPDADYTREVMTSTSTWNTNVIAKEFGMSAKSLNQHLKNLGLQYKQHNVWMLTDRYQNKGYTKTTTFKYVQSDGTVGTRLQMEWTEKGRRWLHELHKQGKF